MKIKSKLIGGIMPFEIHPLTANLISPLVQADGGEWWRRDEQYWKCCYEKQEKGQRSAVVAVDRESVLAYAYLNWSSQYPHFRQQNIPEICDLRVAQRFRKRGIATAIISHFERLAVDKGYKAIGIGVGLYGDYGMAQKLYTKLGYSPDGQGITYKNIPVQAGNTVRVDDDLIMWFVKFIT